VGDLIEAREDLHARYDREINEFTTGIAL